MNWKLSLLEVALTVFLVGAGPSHAWGPQGHRVSAGYAEQLLSSPAREGVKGLLGAQTLASASTWADEMRGNPSVFWQDTAGPWHYVTVPAGQRYLELSAPPQGDALTAMSAFCATLLDPDATLVSKQLALRFTLHIIQDLHQPMHVGNGRDRGGNRIKLALNGKTTNLHRVWDSAIIRHQGLSDAAWVTLLAQASAKQRAQWGANSPPEWVAESAALRDRIYPTGNTLGNRYLEQYSQDTTGRLRLAGARTATFVNGLFSQDPHCWTLGAGSN